MIKITLDDICPITAEQAQAAWAHLTEHHLSPSEIFILGTGMQDPTPAEVEHLLNCALCKRWYDVYRFSDPPFPKPRMNLPG